MDEQLIDIPDIIGLLENIFGSDTTCDIFKPCTLGTKLIQTEYLAKRGQIDAPKVILSHLKMKHLTAITRRPPEMQQLVTDTFTTLPPSETFGEIPQSVRVNAANASSSNLRRIADISKPYSSTKSSVALNKIESTIDRLGYMSKEEREQAFVIVQAVVLLDIITALVKEKQLTGAGIDYYRRLDIEIRRGDRPIDDMYKVIHEYILHMYRAKSNPSTTSADLLQFIRGQLPVLSASMSSYYQGEKDIIDFKIYLPLLEKYIELVLRESLTVLESILLKGDSIEIAESIMKIIREHICAFVQVARDPAICIRHTIVHNAEKLIIKGVRNFLSDYTPPNKRRRIAGGSLNRNRNHSPIKKYKNRTKHRTMRRTKYRTKRKTKYITSRRYKIKNKKTRKVYKY